MASTASIFTTSVLSVDVHSSLVEQRRLQVAFADETANKIQRAVLWGQADNLMMVPTGCDQRSERQGWTGDSGVTADEASLNYDMGRFCKSLRSVVPRPPS